MPQRALAAADLDQFIGSENWYRHGMVRSITYTDGAKYVADAGGAYWLLDEIAWLKGSHQRLNQNPSKFGGWRWRTARAF